MSCLSILIPCYNAEKTIDRCIKSTHFNSFKSQLEIIIINDGSTDSTKTILSKYENFGNIHIFHNENHGLAVTRMQLIAHVSSPSFIFVDSDDYFRDEAIMYMLELLNKKNDCDLYFFKTIKMKNNKMNDFYICHNLNHNMIHNVSENFFPFWNTIFNTKFFKRINPHIYDGNSEDWGVMDFIVLSAKKVSISNYYTLVYDVSNNNSISRKKIHYDDLINVLTCQMKNLFDQVGTVIDMNLYSDKINLWYTYTFLKILLINKNFFKWPKAIKFYKNSELYQLFSMDKKPKFNSLYFIKYYYHSFRKIRV